MVSSDYYLDIIQVKLFQGGVIAFNLSQTVLHICAVRSLLRIDLEVRIFGHTWIIWGTQLL